MYQQGVQVSRCSGVKVFRCQGVQPPHGCDYINVSASQAQILEINDSGPILENRNKSIPDNYGRIQEVQDYDFISRSER